MALGKSSAPLLAFAATSSPSHPQPNVTALRVADKLGRPCGWDRDSATPKPCAARWGAAKVRVITPIASTTVNFELGLGYLLVLPLWIAAIGVITGRVLGVQIGRWRTAVAAIIGWLVGLIAGLVALGPHNQHPLLVVTLSVFFGVLAALPVAIVIDVVTRGRRRRRWARRTLRHPVRATRSV